MFTHQTLQPESAIEGRITLLKSWLQPGIVNMCERNMHFIVKYPVLHMLSLKELTIVS